MAARFPTLDDYVARVSKHSHPKVAANGDVIVLGGLAVSTHSHPKVAANTKIVRKKRMTVSTHSHPKVAA